MKEKQAYLKKMRTMTNFKMGFIIGLLVATLLLSIFTRFYENDANQLDINSIEKISIHNVSQKRSQNNEPQIMVVNSTLQSHNVPTLIKIEDNKIRSLTQKKIDKKISYMNDEQLEKLLWLIDYTNKKLPNEIFNQEAIDHSWATIRQAELEYSFYDESSLRDIGTLKSVVCKSKHCQIEVEIPSYHDFNPSSISNWIIPASVNILSNKHENQTKLIKIIISR